MPFRVHTFQKNIELRIEGKVRNELLQACQKYTILTQPQQKTHCIHEMMNVLDREVDVNTRQLIMEACGHSCIGNSVIEKARRLLVDAQNLDDFLYRLNQAHIGGSHLQRRGETVHAVYYRCYCGSVSKTREPFSATYCHCSCGWYQRLFEALLNKPVEVELLGSIIQGNESCQFLIHIRDYLVQRRKDVNH